MSIHTEKQPKFFEKKVSEEQTGRAIGMREKDWQKLKDEAAHNYVEGEPDFEGNFIELEHRRENDIIESFASKKNIDFKEAREELTKKKEIFLQPILEIKDDRIIQNVENNKKENAEKQIEVLKSIGERAINEFKKNRPREIIFSDLNFRSYPIFPENKWINANQFIHNNFEIASINIETNVEQNLDELSFTFMYK